MVQWCNGAMVEIGWRPQYNQAQLGWHAVPTLPEASDASETARLARGANTTSGVLRT